MNPYKQIILRVAEVCDVKDDRIINGDVLSKRKSNIGHIPIEKEDTIESMCGRLEHSDNAAYSRHGRELKHFSVMEYKFSRFCKDCIKQVSPYIMPQLYTEDFISKKADIDL